jgi:hypothetical protein
MLEEFPPFLAVLASKNGFEQALHFVVVGRC